MKRLVNVGKYKWECRMSEELPDKLILTIPCKQGAVRAVRFNVGGEYCLTCGSDKAVRLWNPHRGVALKTYTGHGYEVLDAQASGDNSQICSGGMDKTVMLFDVATGKSVRKYRGHAGTVNCVKFNEASTLILSGSIDSTVRIWDCRTKKLEPIQILDEATDGVTSIQVSDKEILTGSTDGRIRRYDLRVGKLSVDLIGSHAVVIYQVDLQNAESVTSVNFTRDGQCMLTSTLDSSIKLIDKDTGEMLNEYTGHKNDEYKLDSCLNAQDTHVLSGSEDGHVYIWDLVEAKVVKKLAHDTQKTVHSLSYHPEDTCLLTASLNKMYVWKSKYAPSMDTT